MRGLRGIIFLTVLLISFQAQSQQQLVLLKREKILARYLPGSVIIYKLKNSSSYATSLILSIQNFSIVTSFDTIRFSKIEKISLKGIPNKGANNLFGSFIMLGGIGYYAVDQINSIIVKGEGYDSDPAVWKPSAILVGSGFLLKQLHRRAIRLRYPVKLFTTEQGQPFYQSEN